MSVSAASLFFAVLALCCLTATIAVAAGVVLRGARGGSPTLDAWRVDVGRASVGLAAAVTMTATLGSLYYSEVANFVPCTLCWYQRIFMYSSAVVLVVAALRNDRGVRWYVLPLALIGAVISAYHSWIQAFPPDSGTSFCTADAPCTTRHVWEFGFVSLPFMALSAFLFTITMMVMARPTSQEASRVESPEEDHALV
jgi:disulfide bond formation protein DsbB